jgi:DnaA family protein
VNPSLESESQPQSTSDAVLVTERDAAPIVQLPLDLRLRDASRFETFHVGSQALLVVSLQAMTRLVPQSDRHLFLHGGPGTGKTHLLQAASNAAFQQGIACAYLPLRELLRWSPEAVLEGLERRDLLCIDDLQVIVGHHVWERALFGLINRLREGQKRLVLAADRPPDHMGIFLQDLRSRLSWGPVFRLDAPEESDLRAILQKRSAARGLHLSANVANFLLRHVSRDLDHLLALLHELDLAALAERRRLTIPFIRAHLRQRAAG